MPRWDRKRRDVGRGMEIPPAVVACLDAVNAAGNDYWHQLLERVRSWRRVEMDAAQDPEEMLNRHLEPILPRLISLRSIRDLRDPPSFEDAAMWLVASGRDRSLYRCTECRKWFVAAHNRAERCGAAACVRSHARKRKEAERDFNEPSRKRRPRSGKLL